VGHPQLESWKVIIEAIEEQLGKIEAELRAAAPRKLIFGEGELTHELLARELIDPQRFRNSRQVGQLLWALPE
jgi:transposase